MNLDTEQRLKQLRKQAEENYSIDFLILHCCDNMLLFHSVESFRDIMELTGKKTANVDINDKRKLRELLPRAKNIICYRTYSIPDEIPKARPDLPIGYMIDDNIFYEGKDSMIGDAERITIRNCIAKADYCLAYSPNLADEIRKYNSQTYAIEHPPLWKSRYDKYKIINPIAKTPNSIFTIGITTTNHFSQDILITIVEAVKNLGIKIKIIYFHNKPIKLSYPNITFEHHKPTGLNVADWYNKLHSLNLDLVYIQFPNHILIAGKSDLKFRESAYIKTPLLAVDPTQKIYTSIINGHNGYSVPSKGEALEILRQLVVNPELCRTMGENAYRTLEDRSAHKIAEKITHIFQSIKKKRNEHTSI